jgi:hypothetical protein
MPQFTTRVELHYANGDDYSKPHAAMEKRSFSRWIMSDKGIYHALPTAEYDRSGYSLTIQEVLNDAKAAAAEVKQSYCVLVTEANGRMWYNLPEAK